MKSPAPKSTPKSTPKSKSRSAPRAEKIPRDKIPAQSASFPIVAVGASAGGLEAYTDFFHALPADTGMAFVLIQHLDPSHHSMLTEIIAKATRIPVEEVRAGVTIRPNRVYVIPPNALMAIDDCVFKLSPRGKGPGQHLAVNFFMRSLAQEQKSRAIGIIFSGTGADGTAGMEEIKAEGGITFAQDPATARYDGMPRSAIDSGCVDFVLPPRKIAEELHRIQHHPYVRAQEPGAQEQGAQKQGRDLADSMAPPSHEKDFLAILHELRKTSGVDFTQYKPNTIHRRTLRRMVILKLDSLGEYATHLKEHPEEAGKLYDDVLIPVTSFFRDFEAFEALKKQVYPAIVKDKGSKGAIRMWAPGCSTGEETYSLAMTLLEFLGDKAASFQIQIFGTDLNEKGIQHARAGVYRDSIAEEISPERMARFFVKVDGGYRVNKAVRDMCVFARQNLANDPPFSQMNVVACRNLLIYIQPVLQKKIIPILHYALKPSGFLVLGGSESVSAFPELFSTVDKKHKIYAKKAIASRLHYDFVQSYYPTAVGRDVPGKALKPQVPEKGELDVQAEADRLVLKQHAPVGAVIDSEMEVVQFRGRTTPYLEPAPGKPSLNVLKLARNGLAMELRTLIAAAAKKDASAKKDGVAFDANGHNRILNLSVSPLGEKGTRGNGLGDKRFFLVLFDDVTPLWTPAPGTASRGGSKAGAPTLLHKQESRRLKQELSGTQEALRSAIESEDSLKEEFQSANEEILSANEELQSTNEELETSKEELQSANEELNTLNAELRNKNSEFHELGNDISNLLNSTRIPVVMLDRRLRIRRFTPTADKLLKVVPSDIGRPVGDIKLNIEAPDLKPHGLESMIAKVLESLQPMERDVRDLEGHWHSLSILPYQTQDNKIDGVVLALQDIDALKFASEQLRNSSDFFRGVLDTVRGPLLVLDHELRILSANKPFLSTFQVSSEETINKFIYDLGNGQWNIPKLRGLLNRVLSKKEAVTDFEIDHDFESIGRKTMVLNARTISSPDAQPMLLLAIDDITERKQAEATLRESEERFRALFASAPMAVFVCDRDAVLQGYNRRAVELWGREPVCGVEKHCGSVNLWLPNGELLAHDRSPIVEVLRTGVPAMNIEVFIERPDGSRIPVLANFAALKNADGEITGAITTFVDITERKQAEQELRVSEERFRMVADNMSQLAWTCDQLGNVTWYNQRWLDYTGMTFKEMKGWDWSKVQHPDHLDRVVQGVKRSGDTGEPWEDIFPMRGKDGTYRWFLSRAVPILDADGRVVRWFGTNTDITERKLSEAALIKSEKLAASGRLAATLAHEINNPLQAVTNLLALLGHSPGLDAQHREYATMAEEELGRVTHLTQQSLGFYRESTSPTAVNVEEVLEAVLNLYDKRIKAKDIAIATEYRLNEAIVSYPGEIRQVFTTLLVNAMEAVPISGTIALRVRKSCDWKNPEIQGVRIVMADNGIGIPTHNAVRVFEPFFTTKGEQGTGLGLWVTNGIVNRLGGSICWRSSARPGKSGTSFSIFLPSRMPRKI